MPLAIVIAAAQPSNEPSPVQSPTATEADGDAVHRNRLLAGLEAGGSALATAAEAAFAQAQAEAMGLLLAKGAPFISEWIGSAREAALARGTEAIPADKYTWRPAEGVRSVSEVLLHVTAGNFSIPRRIGAVAPEGLDVRNLEKSTTDKAKVIELLKSGIAAARDAIAKLPDSELEKTSAWFDGRQITNREVAFFVGSHDHEHLGQLIAYARMNGVTPPWSMKEN